MGKNRQKNKSENRILRFWLEPRLSASIQAQVSNLFITTKPQGKKLTVRFDYKFPETISDKVLFGHQPVVFDASSPSHEQIDDYGKEDKDRPEIQRFARQQFWFIQKTLAELGCSDVKLRDVVLTSPFPPDPLCRRIDDDETRRFRELTQTEIKEILNDPKTHQFERWDLKRALLDRPYFEFVPTPPLAEDCWRQVRYVSIRLLVKAFITSEVVQEIIHKSSKTKEVPE